MIGSKSIFKRNSTMFRKLVLGVIVALATIGSIDTTGFAQQQTVSVRPETAVQATRHVTLPINKSQTFQVKNQMISKVAVGNSEVVDAKELSADSFYVLGVASGTTNISVYGDKNQLLAVFDVTVIPDLDAIKATIHSVLPSEKIDVRAANDSVVLSGIVSSSSKIARAMEIAQRFANGGKDAKDRVINDMRVSGTQQVMLEVKVAEMQRSVSKQLGFLPAFNVRNPSAGASQPFPLATPFLSPGFTTSGAGLSTPNSNAAGFSSTTDTTSTLTSFAVAAATAVSGNFAFNATISALEQKGAVKVLAEPNLIALSGDTASFLAGGEFPVPVSENTSAGVPTVTVQFKPFGISLAFTPTVLDGDLINLVVAPEVSQLDNTSAVRLNGFVIPGIATRRAKTTVEVRDGQSFAIAGLLSSDFTDTLRGIPGIMDVPVLGALARSTDYQRNETELVIVITPKLVHPAPAGTLKAPTDSFVPPSDAEIFLLGRPEGQDSGLIPGASGGGLSGKFGHIVR
jgi:pilus assembly protein CpaC